jgi:D-serine deaminase-like pyridoxal phosphate-dependent protein
MTNENLNKWYSIRNVDQLDSPAFVLYPERVKKNIRLLKAMIDDPSRLRPHAKTHKTKEATLLMMAEGINKFKCATIAEGEMLAMCGAADVLFAYQPEGPKLNRLATLVQKYPATQFSCLTDNLPGANEISGLFASLKMKLPVYIDLDIGQHRTGIVPGKEAIALFVHCSKLAGIDPKGLHAYDGHLHDKDLHARTAKCNDAFAKVQQMNDELKNAGYGEQTIIAGGSPTFPIHAQRKKVECSPGTFVFWDEGYLENCEEQPFLPAAVLVTRIISLPGNNRICLDLGHKSVSSENELGKRVFFPSDPNLKAISHSEEHLVMEAAQGHSYKPGDVMYGLPWHVCPTVALYERAYIIEDGNISGEWKIIARDRKITV